MKRKRMFDPPGSQSRGAGKFSGFGKVKQRTKKSDAKPAKKTKKTFGKRRSKI